MQTMHTLVTKLLPSARKRSVLILLVAGLISAALRAATGGSISGTVADPSGAVVSGLP
jgi:hypothetical protein